MMVIMTKASDRSRAMSLGIAEAELDRFDADRRDRDADRPGHPLETLAKLVAVRTRGESTSA